MKLRKLIEKRWWLIIGSAFYILTVATGTIAGISPDVIDTLYGFVDWLAASVMYFFLGAFFGQFIDWFLHWRKTKHPDWFWYTLALWLASVVLSFVFIKKATSYAAEFIFMPFAYGIFFPAATFNILFHSFVQNTFYGKLVLDTIFVIIFGSWLYLAITAAKETNVRKWLRRILLLVLFAVLFFGMVGCVQQMSLA